MATWRRQIEIGPKEIPQTATAESAVDFLLHGLDIVNTDTVAHTIWIRDRQTPARYMVYADVLQPTQNMSGDFRRGRPFPGGLEWWADGPGVHGTIVGEALGA